jgi:hypothetical protein
MMETMLIGKGTVYSGSNASFGVSVRMLTAMSRIWECGCAGFGNAEFMAQDSGLRVTGSELS